MSQVDIEVLRAGYEAASRADWDALLRVMHRDIEWKTTLRGTHRGHEEVKRFLEDQAEPFEEQIFVPEDFLQVGERIVVRVLIRARSTRAPDAVLEIRNGQLWTMRDGKIARCESFPKPEDALEAAGLSE
jgi:ketosteroid isomerase-like protein